MSVVRRMVVSFAVAGAILGPAWVGTAPAASARQPSVHPASVQQGSVAQPSMDRVSVAQASVRQGSATLTAARPSVDAPRDPSSPATPGTGDGGVSIDIDGGQGGRSQSVTIIVLMTLLSVAPSVLLMMTSFTKIIVVLALARQAIGTPTIPPNQVIAGVALFLSLFVMGPVLSQVNDLAIRPYLDGSMSMTQAFEAGEKPLRTFMLKQTGKQELATMVTVSGQKQPADPADVEFTTLVPAFVLSELKTAFIIGFVIFIPFLVIDLVVASVLMSMGMMMLPPVMISMPFKILLFIMVDGWSLITTALVAGYLT